MTRSYLIHLAVAGLLGMCAHAQTHPLESLIETARTGPSAPGFKDLVGKILTAKGGTAVWGQDFLFVAAAEDAVSISIDGQPPVSMARIPDSNLWMRLEKMRTGVTHSYQYFAAGKALSTRADLTGYNPDSYPRSGVAKGRLSEKHTITSKIFDGMKADWWVYASPGVDAGTPAPLMVWQDGQTLISGDLSRLRLFTVTENLVAQKLIPPMVHVMIAPGFSPEGKAMRSIEYDTVTDRYARFLMDEVLPEVEKLYKLRQDGYSRAIGGESSGGICSFNVAWFVPDKFARVHSTIGSYTSIQWRPQEKLEGGNVYPFKVRKEEKRNIRVWMSDGADDLENAHGSWPLQNIQLANSLKMREYDYHFRFGQATHNSSQAALDLPESLAWLWRGYDAAKTSEAFVMDPAEKEKPYYRVTISNRDAW
ncbi:alpha/beta hydrolase-fold protein [uncultured Paludibaculum sp.]|uniref:alpha/beta hydrolase n=1 Tax=uncultured Paludibaculum sp. TaxID=1765020 RepID=UPI002AAAFA12|nr:alpha/beta hydrolase-fold protein [uncultured Paludibaculum sp.]